MQKLTLHLLTLALGLQAISSYAQTEPPMLPRGFAPGEELKMDAYLKNIKNRSAITTPPTLPVRTAAQWEESQALLITWTGFPSIHRQIIAAAQLECKVIIHCADSNAVKTDLVSNGIPLTNLHYIETPFNSIWIRDYAANTCYLNDVDSLVLVDWIYNRPRPDDDQVPVAYSNYLNIPLYQTTVAPNDIMNTGGNWMVDGMGTALASKLILEENDGAGPYSLAYPNHTEPVINSIMDDFHGLSRYIKMDVLPYDDIHHIDMHMKFLDEKTILLGEFPVGISDGPQIEANLAYVMSNFNDPWGNPYKIVRIPMPPSTGGSYAGAPFGGAYYRTYSNFIIINKTVIMPVYRDEYDTTAVRIIKENMPGYTVATIDADNSGANLISQGGVIHCITHSVGVSDPLRIVHNYLPDTYNTTTPYQVDAIVQHKTGIQYATLYYTIDTTIGFTSVPMTLTGVPTDTWTGYIPAYPAGSKVFYYIKGHANSGKEQVRPMVAPDGNFEFNVLTPVGVEESTDIFIKPAYPNPSHGITCIPVSFNKDTKGSVKLFDMLGKEAAVIFEGDMMKGEKNHFINGLNITPGAYMIVVQTTEGRITQKLMVR
ncbi:MAG: agmatine deiminase family protein [Bacteroidota bacterium]|nr:agmatine deiminase family protein [Bacteroidota bacterium]